MNYKIGILFILGLFFYKVCNAELRDPTKPASYSANKKSPDRAQIEALKLSSIWVSGQSKRVIINGEKAKQGETILSDVRIIKIYNDSVLIKQNGIRKKLYLLTHSYKTRSSK